MFVAYSIAGLVIQGLLLYIVPRTNKLSKQSRVYLEDCQQTLANYRQIELQIGQLTENQVVEAAELESKKRVLWENLSNTYSQYLRVDKKLDWSLKIQGALVVSLGVSLGLMLTSLI